MTRDEHLNSLLAVVRPSLRSYLSVQISGQTKERERKLLLLEEAYAFSAYAPPNRLNFVSKNTTGPLVEIPWNELNFDQLTTKIMIAKQMIELNPSRAREMLEQLVPTDTNQYSCSTALFPKFNEAYSELAKLTSKVFSGNDNRKLLYIHSIAIGVRSALQLPGFVDFLMEVSHNAPELASNAELIADLFSKVESKDPTYTIAIVHGQLTRKMANLAKALPGYTRLNISLMQAYKHFALESNKHRCEGLVWLDKTVLMVPGLSLQDLAKQFPQYLVLRDVKNLKVALRDESNVATKSSIDLDWQSKVNSSIQRSELSKQIAKYYDADPETERSETIDSEKMHVLRGKALQYLSSIHSAPTRIRLSEINRLYWQLSEISDTESLGQLVTDYLTYLGPTWEEPDLDDMPFLFLKAFLGECTDAGDLHEQSGKSFERWKFALAASGLYSNEMQSVLKLLLSAAKNEKCRALSTLSE